MSRLPSRYLTCSRFLKGQSCVKSPIEEEDDNDGAASLDSSTRPVVITLGSWRNPPNHGTCGLLSFLPCLWNVQQLTPGTLVTLLQSWVRQRWDAEPRLALEGSELSGLTIQVGAVRQDGHYITYSDSWNSGARKPKLCARCSSSNWLNPDSNLYHAGLIEVSWGPDSWGPNTWLYTKELSSVAFS